ncbi:MAG: hypothetical protein AB1631_05320 [Acidobacteriota bacterium]
MKIIRHFGFKREAVWILVFSAALPLVGILFALVIPMIVRYFEN